MSWIETINNDFIITTGDGKEYTPLYLNAVKKKSYNVAEFEFPNIDGTLVKKSNVKGARYDFDLYFQGDDCIDVGNNFSLSCDDNRPWKVIHPFYGSLTVQISELTQDNSKLNVSKFTGTLIETITDENPRTKVLSFADIAVKKALFDAILINNYDVTPTAKDVELELENLSKFAKLMAGLLKLAAQAQAFNNLMKKALSAVSNAISAASKAVTAAQSAINAPALFVASVKSRVASFTDQVDTLRNSVGTLTGKSSKRGYETQCCCLISAQVLASVKPQTGDYKNKPEVIAITETLIDNYNNFISDLDGLQSENGGDPDSYIPNAETIIALNQLISSTVSVLLQTALSAKQERKLILEDDTDIINLTHRLYGLDPFDNNITEMMDNNNFGINDILEIRKGTTITYYI